MLEPETNERQEPRNIGWIMHDLRVVIPAHNEEDGLGDVVQRVKAACPSAEIIVVNDGSWDNTANIAEEYGIKVITNSTNYGYGKSLKIGLQHDLARSKDIRYFAFLDADGTYPPEDIPLLYHACRQRQIAMVVGSRFLGGTIHMPRIRKLGNQFFALLASFYTRKRVSDTATGLRVFHISLLDMLDKLPDGLSLTPSWTTMVLLNNISYLEIPINYGQRTGDSKLHILRDGYRFLRAILDMVRRYRPVRFYLTLGIPFLVCEVILKVGQCTKGSR